MSARAGFVPSAMVNNNDQTFECFANCTRRENVGSHVSVFAFGANETAIKGIKDNDCRVFAGVELPADIGNESGVILNQVSWTCHDAQRGVIIKPIMPPLSFRALGETMRTFECAV